jgi:hypothetical protein
MPGGPVPQLPSRRVDSINLYGAHTVDIADELARLDPYGYRPVRHPFRTPT